MKENIIPLTKNGSRLFNIGDLAKALQTTRDNVTLLINMPGFPYMKINGREKPMFVEFKVAEFLDSQTQYKSKL